MSGLQGKYDVELVFGDESYGYMLDRSVAGNDQDLGDTEPVGTSASDSDSKAGVYGWKDQRNMPGVAISDFRGGQGQLVLDREDASINAFRDGRHLACSVEGQVGLSQSLISVVCEGIENHIIEANGTIWAAFTPDDTQGEELDPKSVRYLERYSVTLDEAVIVEDTDITLVTTTDVETGDWLYDPDVREVFVVTGSPTVDSYPVDRAKGVFDNGEGLTVALAHSDGTVLYGYGWRSVDFTAQGVDPDEWVPSQPVRSFAFDGQYLYVAFSAGNQGGHASTIWRCTSTAGPLTLFLEDVPDIQQISYGTGWMYYATTNEAGYIGYADNGTTPELNQLSLTAVVGDEWDVNHFKDTERNIMAPTVDSVGMVMNNTWCYWVTTAGRNSWAYRIQAPTGFELVHPFPRGFIATCVESAFGNVYVGGYNTLRDGNGLGVDSYEGVVYLLRNEVAERICTIDLVAPGFDNRIKGVTAVGQLLHISTNTQVYHYSVKSAGWWHVGNLPPRDFDTKLGSITVADGEWDFTFACTQKPTADAAHWEKLAESTTPPVVSILDDEASEKYLNVASNNGRYVRYLYKGTLTGLDTLVSVELADTSKGALQRRALEVSIANGEYEARFRAKGVLDGTEYMFGVQVGRWRKSRSAWEFEGSYMWPAVSPYTIYCQLSPRGAWMWVIEPITGMKSMIPLSPIEQQRKQTGVSPSSHVWVSGGIKIGDDVIVYHKSTKKWIKESDAGINRTAKFRAAIKEIRITNQDMSPQQYTLSPADGTGSVAELDGEIFVPLMGDEDDPGLFCFTRYGETYSGPNAYIVTSDSYQNMGTAAKFYRRFEIALPSLLDGQSLRGQAFIDDIVSESHDVLEVVGVGTAGLESRGTSLLQKVINRGGIKARVRVDIEDTDHLRHKEDRLKINSIAVRFKPTSSPLSRVFTFSCIDSVECRDGSLWDVDAAEAVDFVKRMKKSGSVIYFVTDEGRASAFVDAYQFTRSAKDENASSVKQGQLQVQLKVIDE